MKKGFISAVALLAAKGEAPRAAELLAKGINLKPKKEKLYLKIGQADVKKM